MAHWMQLTQSDDLVSFKDADGSGTLGEGKRERGRGGSLFNHWSCEALTLLLPRAQDVRLGQLHGANGGLLWR